MSRLEWDAVGTKTYESGVDRGVLYLPGQSGVPWNGLTQVSDTPDGGSVTSYWLDGVKYLDVVSGEDYKANLSAYTYPEEFEICQGYREIQPGLLATAQPHTTFGLSYRSHFGNDVDGALAAYRIHIVFNATVAPMARTHKTLVANPELDAFSWDIVATPIYIPGMRPTAHLILDSRKTDPQILSSIEAVLYGDEGINAHLPTLESLLDLIAKDGGITVTLNDDGTWTATGPDEFFSMPTSETFQITEANVTYLDDHTYLIQSTGENNIPDFDDNAPVTPPDGTPDTIGDTVTDNF